MAEREILSDLKCLSVADTACKVAGCKAFWGYGNQLYTCAGCRQPTRDEPSGVIDDSNSAFIYDIRWDTDMHSAHSRKLVNESCNIFTKLQQQMELTHETTAKKGLILKYSREYRSVIKACIVDQHESSKLDIVDNKQLCIDQLGVLEMMELLWSLCEILLIDMPGGLVLKQLRDWWKLRFVDYDEKAQVLLKMASPEQTVDYWNIIFYFAFQGRTDDVCHMLSLHSAASSSAFRIMEDLLRSMPVYSPHVGQSQHEFEMRWQRWHTDSQQHLDTNTFIHNDHLLKLCRILSGDEAVFTEERELLGTWYCMMISSLFYRNPIIQVYELQNWARTCIVVYGGLSQITPWDSILLAAIELDIHQVIHQCSSEFRNWWLVSHLTDLLHHHGALDSLIHSFGCSVREFLILEYASSLMSHSSLWQVGVCYLEHCSVFGKHFMANFLEHLPIDNEKKALKVLNICDKNGLTDQTRSISKVMAVDALRNDRLGSALYWGLKAKDASFVAFVAEKYLNEYSHNGHFTDLDLIDSLGPSMLLTTKLTFLGKYREFHKLYSEKQLHEAGQLLLSLLTSRVAPKRFWSMLLVDALPLLETDKVIFNSQQTFELLHCLEELNTSQKLNNSSKDRIKPQSSVILDDVENEKTSLIRLALARNLARAIVNEGSSSALGHNTQTVE